MLSGMLGRMTRLTITVPDDLAEKIRQAGGENVSAWAAKTLRDALLHQEAQAIAAYEQSHADSSWDEERDRLLAS